MLINIQLIMYTFILLLVLALVLILLYKWISQPYSVWKRDYVSRKLEPIQVIVVEEDNQKKLTLQQFRQFQKSLPEVLFSLVVPSYNEEKRIKVMLNQTLDFFKKTKYTYEILVINDGSKDKTSDVVIDYIKDTKTPQLYVVQYPRNRGKGGAVRVGMQIARGKYHLMVDADGATQFDCLQTLFNKMKQYEQTYQNPLSMIVGSRHHLTQQQQTQLKRKWYRKIFSFVFHVLLKYFCRIEVMDTQCGFKLFTRESSKILFETLHVERWAFDVELFIISNNYKIKYCEIPVGWEDVEGSHLNLVEASVTMFRDTVLIKVFYLLGLWKFNDKSKVM